MKRLQSAVFFTLCISVLSAASVPAGPIHTRQKIQKERVKQGAQSGELTTKERKALHAEQHTISKTRQKALSDGTMSAEEAAGLTHMQNEASQDIHQLKHNDKKQAE